MEGEDKELKFNIKILVVGDAGVGKTAIIQKYVNNFYPEMYKQSLGCNFFGKVNRNLNCAEILKVGWFKFREISKANDRMNLSWEETGIFLHGWKCYNLTELYLFKKIEFPENASANLNIWDCSSNELV